MDVRKPKRIQRKSHDSAALANAVYVGKGTKCQAEYRRLWTECAMRLFASATPEYPTTAKDAFDAADLWIAELKRRDGNG